MLKSFEYKGTSPSCADIFVNGFKLDGVTAVDFNHEVAAVPEVIVHLAPMAVNINQLVDLHLAFDLNDVSEAVECIRLYARIDENFRDRVKSSIHDILCDLAEREVFVRMNDHERAEYVADLILEELQ